MNLNFAENFKNLRKKKNITQEKLAEVLGVSAQSVSRWEVGICYPDLELLPSIANFFGVTIDSLLSNDADSKKNDVKIFRNKMDEFCEYTEEVLYHSIQECFSTQFHLSIFLYQKLLNFPLFRDQNNQ